MATRRDFLTAGAAGLVVLESVAMAQAAERKGRLKQSATRGCFGRGKDLEQICKEAAQLGLKGIDLVGPKDWPILKKYGLIPTMSGSAGHSLTDGINNPDNHAKAEAAMRELLDQAAANGVPNVIALSGNRTLKSSGKKLTDEEGIENTAAFLSKLKAQAEEKGVTICLELLNSKVNHPDYQCDHTVWGVEVMKRVNSPRVKLLYDIYHMQIMEGDIIRTIKANIAYIGHFHTAGNPGRNEPDATQELNYRPIAQAIVDLGYTGYFAHEYSPRRDPYKSLDEAITLCDV